MATLPTIDQVFSAFQAMQSSVMSAQVNIGPGQKGFNTAVKTAQNKLHADLQKMGLAKMISWADASAETVAATPVDKKSSKSVATKPVAATPVDKKASKPEPEATVATASDTFKVTERPDLATMSQGDLVALARTMHLNEAAIKKARRSVPEDKKAGLIKMISRVYNYADRGVEKLVQRAAKVNVTPNFGRGKKGEILKAHIIAIALVNYEYTNAE